MVLVVGTLHIIPLIPNNHALIFDLHTHVYTCVFFVIASEVVPASVKYYSDLKDHFSEIPTLLTRYVQCH